MADIEQNIETRVKGTVLEEPVTVVIGQKTYNVAPPTVATLILASEAVSRLPKITLDPEKLVQECFFVAKDCRVLGEVAAVLIHGAKPADIQRRTPLSRIKQAVRRLFNNKRTEKDILTDEILATLSPTDLFQVISKILSTMQLSDFFGLTTFLTEVNLLHQTKVEEN